MLDGFPRTIPQAEALTEALAAEGTKIDEAVDIEVPDEAIIDRMEGRRSCPNCGESYHIRYRAPKTENVCDVCGHELVQRADDKPETVAARLQVYHEQTTGSRACFGKWTARRRWKKCSRQSRR